MAPHIGEIVPVISKTAKYTPYLLADYGGVTKYVHHVLSIPGAAQLLPTLGAFAQQWHALIDPKEEQDKEEEKVEEVPAATVTSGNDNNNNNSQNSSLESLPENPRSVSPSRRSPPSSPSSSMLKRNQVAVSGVWEADSARDNCYCCNTPFTFTRRRLTKTNHRTFCSNVYILFNVYNFAWNRHHCRICGRLVCGSCSQNLIVTKALGEGSLSPFFFCFVSDHTPTQHLSELATIALNKQMDPLKRYKMCQI